MMLKRMKGVGITALAMMFLMAAVTTGGATELTMYYPVAVGGPPDQNRRWYCRRFS